MKTREEEIAEMITRIANLTQEQFERLITHPSVVEIMNKEKKG